MHHLPSVSTRKIIWCAPFLDSKRLRSVTSIEFFESIHRDAGCTSDKLKYSRAHFGIE